MARASLAAAAMFAMMWPLRESGWPLLVTVTAVASCVYFAGCVLLGALPRSELARLTETSKSLVAARRARSQAK